MILKTILKLSLASALVMSSVAAKADAVPQNEGETCEQIAKNLAGLSTKVAELRVQTSTNARDLGEKAIAVALITTGLVYQIKSLANKGSVLAGLFGQVQNLAIAGFLVSADYDIATGHILSYKTGDSMIDDAKKTYTSVIKQNELNSIISEMSQKLNTSCKYITK